MSVNRNKRWITIAGVALLLVGLSFQIAAQAQTRLWNGLVGWWKTNEVSGIVAYDSSGQQNHATLVGDASFQYEPIFNGSVNFSGDSGMMIVPYVPALDAPTGTIQFWMKVPALQDADVVARLTGQLVRRNVACGCSLLGIRIRKDGTIYGFVANDDPNGNSPWVFSSSRANTISAGRWQFVALVWTGSTLNLYVDGKLAAQTPYVPVPDTGLSYSGAMPLTFATGTGWAADGTREFIGQLTDVRFYAVARSDGDMQSDYSNFSAAVKKSAK